MKYKLKALAIAMMVASVVSKVLYPGTNLQHFIRVVIAGVCTLSLWILAEKLFFKLDRIKLFRSYIENYKRRREFRQSQKEWFE